MEVGPPRRRRRLPLLLLALVVAAAGFAGVLLGAARSTQDAVAIAAQLAGRHEYGRSIALDDAIAARHGLLYVLDRGDVAAAPEQAQRTMLAWAAALAAAGRVDQAVAVAQGVTDPRLRAQARTATASLLLEAARGAAARGDYALALERLLEIDQLAPGSGGAQLQQLLPAYQVAEAEQLTAAGDGADAVALLDLAAQQGAAAAAASAYPQALLEAAQQDSAQGAGKEASQLLQRLEASFAGSEAARAAASLLQLPQPVTGTLVDHQGHPLAYPVRLSSHFVAVPGGYYTTGPFYTASASATGSFRFSAVPVGGPYTLEVFRDGSWFTLVDPRTGQPTVTVRVTPMVPVDLAFVVLPS